MGCCRPRTTRLHPKKTATSPRKKKQQISGKGYAQKTRKKEKLSERGGDCARVEKELDAIQIPREAQKQQKVGGGVEILTD